MLKPRCLMCDIKQLNWEPRCLKFDFKQFRLKFVFVLAVFALIRFGD